MIARMTERIRILRAEVEGRGSSWLEFRSQEEVAEALAAEGASADRLVNGTGPRPEEREERSNAWTDGTFQTGRLVNGEVRMDGESGIQAPSGTANGTASSNGGRFDDDTLRRAMEERMRALAEDDDDDEGGMHL